jgi:hypothetical protein
LVHGIAGINRFSAANGDERQCAKKHQGKYEKAVVYDRAKSPAQARISHLRSFTGGH